MNLMSHEHVEWHDNKPKRILDDQSPPGSRKDVLRGDFAMVRYTDRDGMDETWLVLCGLTPENRKLVFRIHSPEQVPHFGNSPGRSFLHLELVQDSPGMAREAHEE